MPSTAHDDGVAILAAVAQLAGLTDEPLRVFPDRGAPDVTRVDLARAVLFVGEAKAAEPPCDAFALARLDRYVGWLAAHHDHGRRDCVFALCFVNREHQAGWRAAVVGAAERHGMSPPAIGLHHIDSERYVLWCRWHRDAAHRERA